MDSQTWEKGEQIINVSDIATNVKKGGTYTLMENADGAVCFIDDGGFERSRPQNAYKLVPREWDE